MPIAVKLGRMVTYLERLLTITSGNAVITRSCKVRDKQKSFYLYYHSVYGYQTR